MNGPLDAASLLAIGRRSPGVGGCPRCARRPRSSIRNAVARLGVRSFPGAAADRRRISTVWLLAAALILLAGCGEDGIDQTYGRRRGSDGGASVNGLGVLAGMFEEQGHRVHTIRRLSPKVERFDTIVWAPDDFEPPTRRQRDFLEDWLGKRPGRTLVYIGRDYNAASAYWRSVRGDAPPQQAMEIARRLAKARAEHDGERTAMPQQKYARWFTVRRDYPRRRARPLSSPGGRWTEGIDVSKIAIEIEGRLDIPRASDIPKGESDTLPNSEVLLRSGDAVLVSRVTEDGRSGKILVAANGSFLLNLPLVDHEHRKLAAKLIAQCGEAGETAFLESGPGGPLVFEHEPKAEYPTGLEIMTVWPLNAIILHLIALGVLYCFARFPIFGEPRELPPPPLSDFGGHIDAVGDLLERTRDQAYARQRLQQFQQQLARDSAGGAAGAFTTGKS